MAVAERVADIKQILESKLRQAPTKYEIGQNCGADDDSRHAPPTKSQRRYLVEMIRPTLQRAAHLWLVFRSIVDASDRGFMSRLVIEDSLHNMRKYADLCHVGSCAPPQIMQAIRRNPNAQINSCLAPIPVVEAPLCEDEIGAIAPGLAGDNR